MCNQTSLKAINLPCFQYFWSKLTLFGQSIREIIESWNAKKLLPGVASSAVEEFAPFSTRFQFMHELVFSLLNPEHVKVPSGSDHEISWNKDESLFFVKDMQKYSFLIESEIVKCGKSAFVDLESTVLAELDYMKKHYKGIKFFLSKEQILHQPRFWQFGQIYPSSNYFKHSQLLYTSGIFHYTLKYFQSVRFKRRHKFTTESIAASQQNTNNGPRPVNLRDKIQTCFFLYVGFVVISTFVLCSEHCYLKVITSNRFYRAKQFTLISLNTSFRLLYMLPEMCAKALEMIRKYIKG